MKISNPRLSVLLLIQTYLVNVTFGCRYLSNEHLDCSYASILHLPVFNIDLKTLNVSHNRIPDLKQDSLYILTKVKTEVNELNTNDIQGFNHLASRVESHLEVIDLSWNSITYIHPDSFLFAPKLKYLSLANNRGLQLPQNDLFFIGNMLESLYLSHCNISDLGEHIFKPGKYNLKELFLDHNAIMTIHENSLIYFEVLQIIDLSHNKITSFGVNIMIPLIKVESLKLENNPLICDCSARELFAWSVGQNIMLDKVTCKISQKSIIIPWSEILDDVKCEIRNVRNRRRATDDIVSDSEETEKNPPIVLIIIGIVVAVIIIVFLCACLMNNTHDCMETAGCLLICHHCYQ